MNIKEKYCGVIVPMVTPFTSEIEIDKKGVENIVRRLLQNKCNAFVLGTTGESSSVSNKQKAALVRYAVEAVNGKNLVYAGISSNCYRESIENAMIFHDLGADVAVAHLPCYYPINENQMKAYFTKLADESPLPLMLYNIPSTTNLSIPVELIDELSYHENIVGFKDSERGEERLGTGLRLWKDREDFTFHLGWAAMSSFGLQHGLDGIVPSTGNLVPGLYRKIYELAKKGEKDEADRIQAITNEISAYYQQGRLLSEAIPVLKAMMATWNLCLPYAALPLLTLSTDEQKSVRIDMDMRFANYLND